MSDIDPIFRENYLHCKEFAGRYHLAKALAGYELIDISDPSTRQSYEIMQHYQICRDIVEEHEKSIDEHVYGDMVDI